MVTLAKFFRLVVIQGTQLFHHISRQTGRLRGFASHSVALQRCDLHAERGQHADGKNKHGDHQFQKSKSGDFAYQV